MVQSGKANDYSKPKYSARFAINTLKLRIRKEQFDNMVEIENVIEQYQRLQYALYLLCATVVRIQGSTNSLGLCIRYWQKRRWKTQKANTATKMPLFGGNTPSNV